MPQGAYQTFLKKINQHQSLAKLQPILTREKIEYMLGGAGCVDSFLVNS